MTSEERIIFVGAEGNRLVASVEGTGRGRPPVLLVHGGGQTRYAWRGTARSLAAAGFVTYALDQRGHGESDWAPSQAYAFTDFAADLTAVVREIEARHGERPVVVGASLGGVSALLAETASGNDLVAAIVLVDVTPRMDREGVAKVHGFMGARLHEGFASLDEAADSISAYLPERKRPKSLAGLRKNLRRDPDGRYRWHWDPNFIDGPRSVGQDRDATEAQLLAACRELKVPALLVRGRQSELVSEELAREFLDLVPHAEFVDVSGAGHMVAGDRNDAFTDAVGDFLNRLALKAAAE